MLGHFPLGGAPLGGSISAVTNKTLTAAAGSYALTGTAATLKINRPIVAGAGSYALTGTAAGLKHGWKVAAGAGSYSLTGTAAALRHKWKLAAGVGSYALTGTAATVKHGWKIAAGSGSYLLTGTDAGLIAGANKTLAAGSGSYALTGTAAALRVGRLIAASSGSFVLTGFDATLSKTTVVPPQVITHRYAYDPRDEHEARLRKDREDLQRIIDQAWRIANGEIDPVTLDELPPPIPVDLTAINAAIAGAQQAQDQQIIQTFVADQKLRMEDEAIAVLLLA